MKIKEFARHLFTITLLLITCLCNAQPIIHSHNDYQHTLPFWDAFRNKAGVIEADVYYVNDVLMVAHNKNEIQPNNTLINMYINPIVQLFNEHKDSLYNFYLMIDIKEKPEAVLPALLKLLQQHAEIFNRQINPNAVQVFISGERPPDTSFHTYPSYIMFDGLPGKKYASADLNKIVMISDNFRNYSTWNGSSTLPVEDSIRIDKVIQEAHAEGKPLRLWNAPDNEQCWATLIRLHADVINTDKVKECRAFLNNQKY